MWSGARLEISVNRARFKKGLVCRADDLGLGPKVMGAFVKSSVTRVQSDVYFLEKQEAILVCNEETT